jgi:hypothetical protein
MGIDKETADEDNATCGYGGKCKFQEPTDTLNKDSRSFFPISTPKHSISFQGIKVERSKEPETSPHATISTPFQTERTSEESGRIARIARGLVEWMTGVEFLYECDNLAAVDARSQNLKRHAAETACAMVTNGWHS